ncbi:hypothetical protein TWF694_010897 [Orbilia ellipsospora]|uniref:glucan endo-1,3-beta-D-glucosidase n=1 Tax=Orbilia ellipsospora TaxID=2528407 RepID=A0AAV9X9Z6_9PEZI
MVSARLAVLACAAASIFQGAFALPMGIDKRVVVTTQIIEPIVKVFVVIDQNGNTISYKKSTYMPEVPAAATPTPKPHTKHTTTKHHSKPTTTPTNNDETQPTPAPPAQTSASSGGSSGNTPVSSDKLGTGIVYSPYHNDGTCKDATTVASEVKDIVASGKGYNWLRIYGVDCEQVPNVLSAASDNGLKVMLGIYNVGSESAFQSDLQTLLAGVKASTGDWSDVAFVSVGNEAVNNAGGDAGVVATLLAYAATTRAAVKAAGYTGSVGNTDVWIWYKTFPQLCGEDNIVMINMHPFFDGNCAVENSGSFLKNNLAAIQEVCGSNHQVIISETGWPNAGSAAGPAIPGKAQQEQFLQLAAANLDTYMLLTAYDEGWKPANPSVEQHWGILGTSPSN